MTAPESATSARRTQAAERARQAVALRLAGATFAQIAERLGVTAPAAYKMVAKHLAALAKETAENAEQLRGMEIQRLDALQAALWTDAMRGDEQKVDRVLKIMARRAALLGLDAPAKQEIAAAITRVESYDYGHAIAPLAPGPVADRDAPGENQSRMHGPPLGEDANGG